jgi:hypothetical protein
MGWEIGDWMRFEKILIFGIWGRSSEKGYTRKTTGNRVTRWKELFLGESRVLRCFTKRNGMEGFGFGGF